MTKILAIAWKDLRSTARNVPALVMMLAAPLALAALLGFAFGGGGGFDIAATKVVVANLDAGGAPGRNAGAAVAGILTSKDLKDVLETSTRSSEAAARQAVDDGKAAVAVIIPEDFSAVVYGIGAAAKTQVELYENPTQRDRRLHRRGRGGTGAAGLQRRARRRRRGRRPRCAGDDPLAGAGGRRAAPPSSSATPAASSAGLQVSQRAPRAAARRRRRSRHRPHPRRHDGLLHVLRRGQRGAHDPRPRTATGTLPRLFTTPTRHGVIIGGKFVSVFVTVLAQAVILLVAGRLIFGIEWGRLDAVVLLTLVAAGVAGGLALLVISLTRTPAQAGAIGAGVYLVLALLGGNFTGTAQTGGAYGVVQKFTPNGWLLSGLGHDHARRRHRRHPLAAARPARLRRRLLLLRRAAHAGAVRVRRSP